MSRGMKSEPPGAYSTGTDMEEAYYAALYAGARIRFKMEFENGIVLTDEDIDASAGVTITESCNSDSDLKIGRLVCKQMSTRIILSNRTISLNWSTPFRVWFGLDDDANDATIWVDFGTFHGKRPKNVSTVNVVEFIAYDLMTLFDESADEFMDELTFPITVEDLLDEIAESVGINIVASDCLWDMYDRRLGSNHFKKNSYTYREIMECICEGLGCYAFIQPAPIGDYVNLRWFSGGAWRWRHATERDTMFHEEHADLYAGMSWDEFDALTLAEQEALTWDDASGYYKNRNAFDGIVVSKVDTGVTGKYPSRCTGHLYEVKENPIMIIGSSNKTTHINTYVKPLYERIQSLGGVLPMTVECLGDPTVEAGDIIKVALPEDTVYMPIYYKTMKWNGILIDRFETTAPET